MELTVNDFYLSLHRQIYGVMLKFSEDGEPFDEVTLCQRLQECGQLDSVGGYAYISELTDGAVPHPGLVGRHTQTIRRCAQLRKIRTIAEHIGSSVMEHGADPIALLDSFRRELEAVRDGSLTNATGMVREPCLPQGWQICDLSHAMAGAGQRPPWVIENLLLTQSATQVSAHPHSMKSLAWLAACLESVVTHKVWGHFDASAVKSTLFIETEDPPWVLEERIRGLAQGLGLKDAKAAEGFHYLRTGPFDLVSMEKTLAQTLDYYKPDFVVLSTLQNLLSGRSWKEQEDMQPINALIVRLADQHCPIVEITHSPWNTRQKRAIGTVSQAANFLTAIHFEKKIHGGDTLVHVIVDSKLGAEGSDFTLKLETEGDGNVREVRRFIYETPGWPKGLGRDAVIAAINEDPNASAKEIAERTSLSSRYVQQIKKSMGEQDD